MLLRSWTIVGQQYVMVTHPELPMLPAPKASGDLHEVVIGRVARRLIPFAFICYVVAYSGWSEQSGLRQIGPAESIGLNATAYGIGAGLFSFSAIAFSKYRAISYSAKVGARR